MRNKKLVYLSIGIISIIIIGIVFFFMQPKPQTDINGSSVDTTGTKENPDNKKNEKFGELIGKAIDNKDSNICEEINNEVWKNSCLTSVENTLVIDEIIKSKDIKACDNIEDIQWKEKCIINVKNVIDMDEIILSNNIIGKAIDNKDSNICEEITKKENKEKCIINVKNTLDIDKIIKTNDINECDNLTGDEWKEKCKTIFNEFQNKDIIDKAVENKDINLCKKIDNEEEQENCIESVKNSIIFSQAVKEGNEKKCLKLEDKSQKHCIDSVKNAITVRKAMKTKDKSLCDSNLSGDKLITHCHEMIDYSIIVEKAIKEKNIELCNYIDNDNNLKECKKYVTNILNEESISLEKKTSNIQGYCITSGKETDICKEFNLILKNTPNNLEYLWIEINDIGQAKIFVEIEDYEEFLENKDLIDISINFSKILENNKENEETYGYIEKTILPFIIKMYLPNLKNKDKVLNYIINNLDR